MILATTEYVKEMCLRHMDGRRFGDERIHSPYQILTKHTSVVHKTIAFLSTNYTIKDDTDHSLLFLWNVRSSFKYLPKKGEKELVSTFFKSLILIPVKASENKQSW